MTGRDTDISLRATDHPEFDACRLSHYWIPLDAVIEFKRDVYSQALCELARYLSRKTHLLTLPWNSTLEEFHPVINTIPSSSSVDSH